MPYGQILPLMLALVLAIGAPSDQPSRLPFILFIIIWILKAFMWSGLVFMTIKRSLKHGSDRVSERLLWASFIPFTADLYLLDLKVFLNETPVLGESKAAVEIMTVTVFFLYLLITWAASFSAIAGKTSLKSLTDEICSRSRLLLPALIPYVFLVLCEEVLSNVHIPGVTEWIPGPVGHFFLPGVFLVILLFVLPPAIRWIWGCYPLPEGQTRAIVEGFLRQEGMGFGEILVWPLQGSRACTAAVLGYAKRFRYILLTPCLLNNLSVDETKAVLAHETAHVRFHHLLWHVSFIGSYSLLLYRFADPLWLWILSHRSSLEVLAWLTEHPAGFTSVAAILPVALLMLGYFRFVMGYFMRNFEREADLHVLDLMPAPDHLISALEKISFLAGEIRDQPNWHHFSIRERVDFLAAAGKDPRVKERFRRSLGLKKTAFIAAMTTLVSLSFIFPVGEWEKRAEINILDLSLKQIAGHGNVPVEWLVAAGTIFYEHKEYGKASGAFEKALGARPDDPEALNGLAWLMATAVDPKFKNPAAALALAERAAEIKPAGHILDTLAECLYLNGSHELAVNTERRAIETDPGHRDYYMKQMERFKTPINPGDDG